MRTRICEVILCLEKQNRPLKNGKYPIYIRVQHKNTNRRLSCHEEMTDKEWQRFEKCPPKDHILTLTFHKFEQATQILVKEDAFSFDNLSQVMQRSNRNSIQELFAEKITALKANAKYGTASIYQNTLSSLDQYLEGKRTPVGRITQATCTGYIKWLYDRGNNPTTISMKCRNLNAVLEIARESHLITVNPLKGIRVPTWLRRNLLIPRETLVKLLTATPTQIGAKNYYWLCFWKCVYYGNGLNIQDLLRLQYSDYDTGANEIIFVRRKTMEYSQQSIHIAVIPEFAEALSTIAGGSRHIIPILDAYKNESEAEYWAVKQTVKNINNHLRKICELLDIREHITTYTGRHAFATTLQQKGVPVEFISQAFGHSSIKTTQNYLDGYTPEQRREKARLLTVFNNEQPNKSNI